MDRNSIIGLFLIGIILILFTFINQPERPVQQPQTTERDTATQPDIPEREAVETQEREVLTETDTFEADVPSRYPEPFNRFERGELTEFTLENEKIAVNFTNKGGRVSDVVLFAYKDFKDEYVSLFDKESSEFGYHFFYNNRSIYTADLYFELEEYFEGSAEEASYIVFRMAVDDNRYIEKTYTLEPETYKIDYRVNWVGFENIIPRNSRYIDLTWNANVQRQEHNLKDERDRSTVFYKYSGESPDKLSERSSDEDNLTGSVKWVSFKQKFFSQMLFAENNFSGGKVEVIVDEDAEYVKSMRASLQLPFEHQPAQTYNLSFYFGPNQYQKLSALGHSAERQIPLGWSIFRFVNTWFVIPIFNFLDSFFSSYGLIILLLTLSIKLVTLPLTYKAYLSMAKMKILKPEIDEIKEKAGKDMAKVQQEQMKLYRKAGINPLGGCIPMLLQLPVLIAMFTFFPSSIELRHEAFLWASDLSSYDVIFRFPEGMSIPFYGSHVSLFTLLMAVSTMFYTLMNNSFSGAQKEMRFIAYLMPIVLLFFFNSFPSGLTYYYFLFNVISIGQQAMFKSFVDDSALKRKIEANKKKPLKKSKFQARLEKMAEKQKEIQEQRKKLKKKKGTK